MMKKTLLCWLMVCTVLLAVSCSADDGRRQEQEFEGVQNYFEEIALNPDKDAVSREVLGQITVGMMYDDVYSLIGSPQDVVVSYYRYPDDNSSGGASSRHAYYVYSCSDGSSLLVTYTLADPSSDPHFTAPSQLCVLDLRLSDAQGQE